MTIRIGVILRHEDVHGVSGTGVVAEVIEFSDGSAVARWLGSDASTNCAAGVKNITNVHGHGGKMEIQWLWEQEPNADPMDAVFARKIEEAGGTVKSVEEDDEDAELDAVAEEIATEIVDEAAELRAKVTQKLAVKLTAATNEKVAAKTAKDKDAEKSDTN